MPRVPEISEREQVSEEQRHHFDWIMESRGFIDPAYLPLLNAPDMAARICHVIAGSRFDSSLDLVVKELAICTVARELDCSYEWAAHEGIALEAGVRREAVVAIRDGTTEALTPQEKQIVDYVRALLRPPHRVAEADFTALRARLGITQITELTASVGAYSMLACCLNAFEVPIPQGGAVLPV